MKLYKIAFIIFGVLLAFTSCKEEEVEPFSGAPGLNFMASDGYGGFYDSGNSYENLSSVVDFFGLYAQEKTMDLSYCDVKVFLQLEARISDKPLKIKLMAEPVEGYDMPELEMPEAAEMEAGEYRKEFTIRCKYPKDGKESKCVIKVDYANSDFVPGTMERQQYEITLTDETDWSSMWVFSPEEWNAAYSSVLGNYGEKKVRFIMAALAAEDLSANDISMLYYYQKNYHRYGFDDVVMEALRNALTQYNSTHDKPLTEADGTPVTFN